MNDRLDSDESGRIGVLVADDHAEFRDGLRALLTTIQDIELMGEAASGEEAIERALELQPDVVLMDLSMPGIDGIETTRSLAGASPHIAVLVLTMFDDHDLVFAALRAGARGDLLKGADRADLVRAIRSVASGGAVFGPEVARRLISYFGGRPPVESDAFPELTGREVEILELMAQGLSNQVITERLGVSPKTVRNHVSNIFSKLQVRDRAEAIVRARDAGMGGERHRRVAGGGFPDASGPESRDDGTRHI